MPYVAGYRLNIAGEYREPGEPVPEAETDGWRTVNDLVATGHLVWVDELPTQDASDTPVEDDAEPAPAPKRRR